MGWLGSNPAAGVLNPSTVCRQEPTQKLKQSLISQIILATPKVLFQKHIWYVSAPTIYRLSDGVKHINYEAHSIKMKILCFNTSI